MSALEITIASMRRMLRCALAGLLCLALVASGATLGIASRMAAQGGGAQPSHHAEHHATDPDGQHVHHSHQRSRAGDVLDASPQAPTDHPSKTCCTACTVASPLPPNNDPIIELIVSRAIYSSLTRSEVAIAVSIDPGIPKRFG